MPMVLSLIAPDGKVIKEIRRDIWSNWIDEYPENL
jgi:hypothetical protein